MFFGDTLRLLVEEGVNSTKYSASSMQLEVRPAKRGQTSTGSSSRSECGEYDGPTKRFEQLSSFCDRNPDHSRCDELDGAAAGSANVEVGDGDTEDGQLTDFCERKPDHQRCGDSAAAASQGAVQQDDGDASELAAFCERKPDHQRCEELSD